jgi:hypothetical protein
MKLADARHYKEDVRAKLKSSLASERLRNRVAFSEGGRAVDLSGRRFATAFAAQKLEEGPEYALSVGVAPRREGGYRAAVRVQAARADKATVHKLQGIVDNDNVDFRVIGKVTGQRFWYRDIARPLRIGPSVGHHDVTAGSIGAFVSIDGVSGSFVLSNNHVLANVDRANSGDQILQPGPIDNLAPTQLIIGSFHHAPNLNIQGMNTVDCGVAQVDPSIDIEPTQLWNVGRLGGLRQSLAEGPDIVFKIGRTSGLTWGRISAFELDPIEIDLGTGIFAFENQIEIEGTASAPFSKGGDSGSLIVDSELGAVGLLFAGSTSGGSNGKGLTYANPIDTVLSSLNAKLVL